MRSLVFSLALLAAACGAPSNHHDADSSPATPADTLTLSGPWAAPTPNGVDVSAGYVTIRNGTAEADTLIAVSTPRATRSEIHQMSMDGGVMRMRAMERLEVPAGGEVALAPGGMHLMFFGVSEPFVQGETIPVTLTFEHAGDVDLQMQVRAGATHGNGH
ncbi:MAG: copper chaperone PCu(A)C [Hyphomonadaceae bacterium]